MHVLYRMPLGTLNLLKCADIYLASTNHCGHRGRVCACDGDYGILLRLLGKGRASGEAGSHKVRPSFEFSDDWRMSVQQRDDAWVVPEGVDYLLSAEVLVAVWLDLPVG